MRVGVLTFHACINYGSYWQARCLVEAIGALGHEAVLLDHRSTEVERRELRCAFQPTLPERTPRAAFPALAAKVRAFREAGAALPRTAPFDLDTPPDLATLSPPPFVSSEVETPGPASRLRSKRTEVGDTSPDLAALDAVVVGSDEVWNFRHPWYAGKQLFFGQGIDARLVAYAASLGSHDAEDGIAPLYADLLRRFAAVSVRDDNTRRAVAGVLGAEPATVLDPCLLHPEPFRVAPAPGRYAAIYGHDFPGAFVAQVRAWADARGLPLVSIGYPNPHADEERIDAGPAEFAALMAGAEAVATTFFHGCVFALANCKPFVCAASPYRRNKLRDLAATVGAEAHLLGRDAAAGDYGRMLDTSLDPAIPARIAALRETSREYLAAALG